MVLGIVQGGEVGPVVFDLGAISHIETDRPEYGLDTLPGLNDRMDAGNAAPATGQTDVNGFGGQALVQFGLRHLAAPIVQQAFDLLLQLIRSEEHTSELQSLMRISYAFFCLQKQSTVTTDKKLNALS